MEETGIFKPELSCPDCGSHKIWKYGLDVNGKQKFRCRKCGHVWRKKNE